MSESGAWKERYLTLPRGRTRVRERGEGPLFVWSHGIFFPMDVEEKMPLMGHFEALRGVRMLRYDARGHGGSAPGSDAFSQRWDQLADDILQLADACEAPRFIAGGASMGVAASLFAALRQPERISAMVLLVPPTAWSTRPAQRQRYEEAAALIGAEGSAGLARSFEAAVGDDPPAKDFAAAHAAMVAHIRRWESGSLQRVLQGAAQSDLPEEDALRGLEIPALVLGVPDDPGHPMSSAERVAELLPQAELVRLPAEDADGSAVGKAIAGFLRRVS